MRISLLGGTGDIGQGLALRWAADTDHEILIGSRKPEKARNRAEEYEATLERQGIDREVLGFANEMAADRGDVVVLAVPPYHVGDTVEAVADRLSEDAVLVSPAVGMRGEEAGMRYHPPSAGSVTALVRSRAPESVPVVGAFHNLAADVLSDLDTDLDLDTLVVGDDDDAVDRIVRLAEAIEGLRAIPAGPIETAPEVESLTPLLINIARHNRDMHDVGVRFR